MNGTIALDTMKSFKEIMSPEDFGTFIKGEDSEKLRAFPEVQEFLKAEMPEEETDEEKTAREKKEKEGKEGKEGKEEEEEKAINAEFMKAFGSELEGKFETKFKAITDLLKSLLPTSAELEEIKKSIESVNETVTKIAETPQGTRAIRQGSAAFFAKALSGESVKDENDKDVLSVTASKEKVLKALEKGMEKSTDDELTKAYENSIIRYNGGNGSIAQEVAIDLFEKHNIRLVK